MNTIKQYMYYVKEYPHLFYTNEMIDIVLEESFLQKYSKEKNEKLGIILENQYIVIAVDLIYNSRIDKYYTYTRILNIRPYAGVVIIPYLQEKVVFLRQFRHATRRYELELPRGFSEESLTIEDNVSIEIQEELGVKPFDIQYIGSIVSDTSIVGGLVHVLSCKLNNIGELSWEEGIEGIVVLNKGEIREKVRANEIRDCFTLSALYKITN